ncbi:hypothetical protein [uncultured Corynebacterium sp.]|uniref:hypothetical protein n=1 Tax=uncultured Corynebacterium sp. TaxID=159447 RepID=UPI0025FB8515|nr:hypothetical protein [uncultured Corynebacterium sp.]
MSDGADQGSEYDPEYDPAACRIGVRAGHSIVDVTVWHPQWGSAKTAALRAGLFGGSGGVAAPDEAAARRMLNDALGESTVATWIGSVEVTDHSPQHAVSMADLRELVDRMAASSVGPDGNPAHTELRMDVDGADAVVRTIVPLAPSVAPGRDRHVEVTLHIDPFRATELTGAQVRSTVLALEDALSATVRENRAGLLVAVAHQDGSGTGEAGAGLDGVGRQDAVTLHFYLGAPGGAGADAAPVADPDHVVNTLRATVSTWDLGEASLEDEVDPDWSAVQRYRV